MFVSENYGGINLSNSTERGLIDSVGQLSCMLFGDAMKEDVLDLRNKITT